MALANYTELVAEVQSWLFDRADIAAKVPTFIRLAEAKLNRALKCRQMEQRSTTPINLATSEPEFISLPEDFHSMRRMRLTDVAGKPRLKFLTGVQMDTKREEMGNQSGQPVYFTVFGTELELLPTPTTAHVLEMVYRKVIPPLTDDDETNWLLDFAPDAYLYGTLMEAAPYLHEDERIQTWASGVQGAIDGLNKLSEEATFNAGPLVMRRRRGRGYG